MLSAQSSNRLQSATADSSALALWQMMEQSGLRALALGGRQLLPVVQGGMGVGVSAHRLAGTVASMGAMGTIASVDLRHHHPDLAERTRQLPMGPESKETIDAANLEALRREIAQAKAIAAGRGLIAVNVMKALNAYAASVRTALEAGADAVVVGAGLPLDLPDLARDFPAAGLVPILSDARGVQLIVRKWERKQRMPAAIVIEHPAHAGGHLGATRLGDVHDGRFEFDVVLPAVQDFLRGAGLERTVPVIAAGGIRSFEDICRMQSLGAAAVQMGTAFAVTEEGDAHRVFKEVLAGARSEDIVEFQSVAGLPARAVRTAWMQGYLKVESTLKAAAHAKARCAKKFDCLVQCGLRDGLADWGQFCIDNQLVAALRGDLKKGLFFRGAGSLPFGDAIRPVRDLFERLLTPASRTAAA